MRGGGGRRGALSRFLGGFWSNGIGGRVGHAAVAVAVA